ncbi:MAG: redoxin domain-containing protein [Cyclobacteriaceae bacterium]|nr:redoxin domain-containing protein [Cyclobacteriaceae bacterium]
MRKLVFLFLALPFSVLGQTYSIKTTVRNSTDTVAYLGHHFATQRYLDDTAKVVDGKAVFEGIKKLEPGIYFYYTPNNYFEFLVEDQKFSLEATSPDFVQTMKIKNSPLNEGFYKLQRFTAEMKAKSKPILDSYDSTSTEEEKALIKEQMDAINKQVEEFQDQLKEEYKGTLLAKLITLMQSPRVPEAPEGTEDVKLYKYLYYKNHFWDGIDITDPGTLRSPLLDAKINDYLDNVVVQQSDSVIKEVDKLLDKAKGNKETFRYLLITLANKYERSPVIDFDKVFVHLVEDYYLTGKADEWATQETIDKLRNRINMIKPNFIGNPAPELVLWDTLGAEVNIRDIDANYLVLYFYDPDCGHCKKKTPELYANYPDLVAKGVEVIGVDISTDEKKWKDFIKKDDLGWINLADLNNQTYFRYYYDIRSTPTVYILDKDKKIRVKKIDVLDVPVVIDQLIKQDSLKEDNP